MYLFLKKSSLTLTETFNEVLTAFQGYKVSCKVLKSLRLKPHTSATKFKSQNSGLNSILYFKSKNIVDVIAIILLENLKTFLDE